MRTSWLKLLTGLAVAIGLSASMVPVAQAQTAITVGSDTTFPPFEWQKDGEIFGFDIDMIRAIGQAEGLEVTIKPMPFAGIVPSLQAGSIDVAVAGMTITKARMDNVNFSHAYYRSGLSVLVRADESDIQGFADLKGRVVATKKATSSVDYMMKNGVPTGSIKQFKDISSAYEALINGGADAVIFDHPVNIDFTNQNSKAKIVGELLTGEFYGIAVSKSKPELVEKMNAGLQKIKASGVYEQLFDKYFGGDKRGMIEGTENPADVAL